jgi:uncharacterized lipoprotein YajG
LRSKKPQAQKMDKKFTFKLKNMLLLLSIMLLSGLQAFSQTPKIKGKITDGNGMPIPGVSVSIKGAGSVTKTDGDGTIPVYTTTPTYQ